jgi:hypothetical protein
MTLAILLLAGAATAQPSMNSMSNRMGLVSVAPAKPATMSRTVGPLLNLR